MQLGHAIIAVVVQNRFVFASALFFSATAESLDWALGPGHSHPLFPLMTLRLVQFRWLCDKLAAIALAPFIPTAMSGSLATLSLKWSWKLVHRSSDDPSLLCFSSLFCSTATALLCASVGSKPSATRIPLSCFVRNDFTGSPPRLHGWGTTNNGLICLVVTAYFARQAMFFLMIWFVHSFKTGFVAPS